MKTEIPAFSLLKLIATAMVAACLIMSPAYGHGEGGGGGGGGGDSEGSAGNNEPRNPPLTDEQLIDLLRDDALELADKITEAARVIRSNKDTIKIANALGNDVTLRRVRAENRAAAQAIKDAIVEYVFWSEVLGIPRSAAVTRAARFTANALK